MPSWTSLVSLTTAIVAFVRKEALVPAACSGWSRLRERLRERKEAAELVEEVLAEEVVELDGVDLFELGGFPRLVGVDWRAPPGRRREHSMIDPELTPRLTSVHVA